MKISIVDSHPVTHYGIKSMIENDSELFSVNKSYFTANDFFKDESNINVPLIVIGLHISDLETYDLLTYIHTRIPTVKTVLYSCHFNKEVILKTIKSGANGIFSKNLNKDNFINGLLKVMASDIFVSIGNDASFTPKNKVNEFEKGITQLTHRENEILNLVKHGIKNKEIASVLNISLSTVEFHRKNIYTKLEVKSFAELLAKTYEMPVSYWK